MSCGKRPGPARDRRGLSLAWDADHPDKTACPPWCTVPHPASEVPADRSHVGPCTPVAVARTEGRGPAFLEVELWKEPGRAAGISVAGGGGYLPTLSAAEARQFAAVLLDHANELGAG